MISDVNMIFINNESEFKTLSSWVKFLFSFWPYILCVQRLEEKIVKKPEKQI